jgi:hypothetical protein
MVVLILEGADFLLQWAWRILVGDLTRCKIQTSVRVVIDVLAIEDVKTACACLPVTDRALN